MPRSGHDRDNRDVPVISGNQNFEFGCWQAQCFSPWE
jgi:hypothetical protein